MAKKGLGDYLRRSKSKLHQLKVGRIYRIVVGGIRRSHILFIELLIKAIFDVPRNLSLQQSLAGFRTPFSVLLCPIGRTED